MKKTLLLVAIIMTGFFGVSNAQVGFNPVTGCVTDVNGNCVPTTLLSAVPFLRIAPDARGGAMGDAGIAVSPDASSMFYNASKLAFAEENTGLGVNYVPWLQNLGLSDIFLAYISGFRKVDELSTVGFGFRYFSLGDINFTDNDGNQIGTGSPREIEFSAGYSRKLSENFSVGLTGKYIYSNLASGQVVGGVDIVSANAFAADISLNYIRTGQIVDGGSTMRYGLTLSNIGSKVSYTGGNVGDFLPANLGLGAALDLNFDEYNSMTFALDLNKLLVPSPQSQFIKDPETGQFTDNPDYDSDGNGIADFREKGLFSGIFGSFGDAQGGFSEELKEFSISFGMEYWYNKQFAVRAGYYYESAIKGDRKFLTVGLGLNYNRIGLNLSYLTPTNNRRNPLDNTLRFSVLFDFADGSASN